MKPIELQADCFAGAFIGDMTSSGQLILTAQDRQTMIDLLGQMADEAGTPDEFAHGSVRERQDAYQLGMGADPAACIERFTPKS